MNNCARFASLLRRLIAQMAYAGSPLLRSRHSSRAMCPFLKAFSKVWKLALIASGIAITSSSSLTRRQNQWHYNHQAAILIGPADGELRRRLPVPDLEQDFVFIKGAEDVAEIDRVEARRDLLPFIADWYGLARFSAVD